jgi:allantoinase
VAEDLRLISRRGDELIGHGHTNSQRQCDLAEGEERKLLQYCRERIRQESGAAPLWSIPYPQELNDIPMIVARQMDGRAFAELIVDNFDEMLAPSEAQPPVMGIALHPYIVGQPHRLRHLRRALQHIAKSPAG